MTTPKQRYLEDLKRDGFVADNAQKQAVELLEGLYQRLVTVNSKVEDSSLVTRFKQFIKTSDKTLARLGDILNARTYSITGDFVEPLSEGMFDLYIEPDSSSADFLSVTISSISSLVKSKVAMVFSMG